MPQNTTTDHFYHGEVTVIQPRKGFRFSVDAPMLADFLPHSKHPALEVGTGSGIISLLALHQNKFPRIQGIDIQPEMVELARMNAEKNGMSDRFTVQEGDFLKSDLSGIRTIFSNPPYLKKNLGRKSPNPQIQVAKAEETITLEGLLRKCREVLGDPGEVYLVYPFDRFEELERLLPAIGFHMGKLRMVHSFKDGKAERFLVQCSTRAVNQEILEPLIMFEKKGVYTQEMEMIFSGK